MKESINQMSALEVALKLMIPKRSPQPIRKLIKEVMEVKGISDDDVDAMTNLYIDITTSSKFVYCGDAGWDLKERQPLELWDRDGSSFNKGEIEEEDDDDNGLTIDDYFVDDKIIDEEEDEEIEEEDEILEEDEIVLVEEEEILEDDFIDEEEYNEIMDDYEDMYEDD